MPANAKIYPSSFSVSDTQSTEVELGLSALTTDVRIAAIKTVMARNTALREIIGNQNQGIVLIADFMPIHLLNKKAEVLTSRVIGSVGMAIGSWPNDLSIDEINLSTEIIAPSSLSLATSRGGTAQYSNGISGYVAGGMHWYQSTTQVRRQSTEVRYIAQTETYPVTTYSTKTIQKKVRRKVKRGQGKQWKVARKVNKTVNVASTTLATRTNYVPVTELKVWYESVTRTLPKLLNSVERIRFLDRSHIRLGNTMANGMMHATGSSSESSGYVLGGNSQKTTIGRHAYKMPFSNETFSILGNVLTVANVYSMFSINSSAKIYFGNGATKTGSSESISTAIYALNPAGDTVSSLGPVATSIGRTGIQSLSYNAGGVLSGGKASNGGSNRQEFFNYATEAISILGSTLPIVRWAGSAVGNNKKGIITGGNGGTEDDETAVTSVKHEYASQSASLLGAQLTNNRYYHGDHGIGDYSVPHAI